MPAFRITARSCLAMATYDFDRFDTSLNAAVLLSVSLCLMITAVEADLDLSALFWLPFAFFAGAVQLLAGVVFGTQGFSLIWCALLGWRRALRGGAVAPVQQRAYPHSRPRRVGHGARGRGARAVRGRGAGAASRHSDCVGGLLCGPAVPPGSMLGSCWFDAAARRDAHARRGAHVCPTLACTIPEGVVVGSQQSDEKER